MGLSGHADPSAVQGVTISFTIVSVSAVLLRLYSRIVVVNSAGRDDAFIAVAALLTVGLTIAQCYQGVLAVQLRTDCRLTPTAQSSMAWAATSTRSRHMSRSRL
jgi:Ni/Fe-hydrogenase subunit HybB-like protein